MPRAIRRWLLTAWLAVVVVVLGAPAAVAQYGGGPNLFVDPVSIVRCETGPPPTFDVFGNAFPPASSVSLTVDGIPGVLATTTAAPSGIFSFPDVVVPPEFAVGNDYTVRASAGGDSATFVVTVVADTSEACEGPLASTSTISSSSSTTTTSISTLPGGGSSTTPTTVPGGGTDGTGGGSSDGDHGGNDGLAVTGLSRLEVAVQTGVTLIGAGFVFALLARRRRDAPA